MTIQLHSALDSGVTEVDGRVYPLIMPQDTRENSLTYRVLASSEKVCLQGNVYGNSNHFQIDVWAKTYSECVEISDKVRTVLHDNFNISGLFITDIYEDYTLKYRRVVDFRIL